MPPGARAPTETARQPRRRSRPCRATGPHPSRTASPTTSSCAQSMRSARAPLRPWRRESPRRARASRRSPGSRHRTGRSGCSFTAGSNGGSAITSYEYSIDAGSHWVSTGTLGTSFVISGLINGTAYSVRVRATNSVGAGVASTAVAATPVGLPGQSVDQRRRAQQPDTYRIREPDRQRRITGHRVGVLHRNGASWATATGTSSRSPSPRCRPTEQRTWPTAPDSAAGARRDRSRHRPGLRDNDCCPCFGTGSTVDRRDGGEHKRERRVLARH